MRWPDIFKKRKNSGRVREMRVKLSEDKTYASTDFMVDGKPHVGIFNLSIMQLNPKEAFGWFLALCVYFDTTVGNDMPGSNDVIQMQDFSDELINGLAADHNHPNALFLGRVTGAGRTQMMWYVNNPEMAHRYLQRLIEEKAYPFQFDYNMAYDGEWRKGHYWLDPLLKK